MTTLRFSANTGYLWQELPFLERIEAAARHGFHAVEFHDEAQATDRAALKAVLEQTGLPVIGLNVRKGKTFGCAACPGQSARARQDIGASVEVAEDIGARAIHVLAGIAAGPEAEDAYLETLRFALESTYLTILIEPVCEEQVPGYFLNTMDQAVTILGKMAHPRLRIMFDCYHVHRQTGSVLDSFFRHADKIAHVQIAAAEQRAEPFPGVLDYSKLLPAFQAAGYTGFFGCEYRPRQSTTDGLGWRDYF